MTKFNFDSFVGRPGKRQVCVCMWPASARSGVQSDSPLCLPRRAPRSSLHCRRLRASASVNSFEGCPPVPLFAISISSTLYTSPFTRHALHVTPHTSRFTRHADPCPLPLQHPPSPPRLHPDSARTPCKIKATRQIRSAPIRYVLS
jgi:hypothetical protein